jgi:bacillithiol biosynthesis cysteine-adding enzyme BshC
VPRWVSGPFGPDIYPALFADLAEHPSRVSRFFPLGPGDPESWCRRADAVDLLWHGTAGAERRAALQAALAAWHARLGPHPAQAQNLAALGAPGALVVVTGQQPGLLGGPLYTLYKALGAVVRAEQAAAVLGRPVVPVFWVASEDHDWSEISRADVIGPDGGAVHLRLSGVGDFRSAGHVPVPPEARRLVGRLMDMHPPRGSGAAVAAQLLAGLQRPGRNSLADWFSWQLHHLLGPLGLLVYDPMEPALRRLAAPVLAGAADRAARANAAIERAGEALRAAGYAPGLDLESDHLHLFSYVGGRRLALHLEDGRVRTRDGQVDWSPADLARRASAEPTGFSPNVALRPIVQDATLPVLCQLAGPGEAAYLAQLVDVYALWDRPVPMVTPRPGATVVLPEDRAAADAAGVEIPELRGHLTTVLDRVAFRRAPVDVAPLVAGERERLRHWYADLERRLGEAAPTLPPLVRTNAGRVEYQLDYLERKVHQHLRRAHRDVLGVVRAAAGRLFPAGGLQERGTIAYPYLFAEGPAFIDGLKAALEACPAPFGRHLLIASEAGTD